MQEGQMASLNQKFDGTNAERRLPENLWSKVKVDELAELYSLLPGQGQMRLRAALGACNAGRNVDLRTPFFREETRERVKEIQKERIGQTKIAALEESDAKEWDKVGVISMVKPAKLRIDGLLEYWYQSWDPDPDGLKYAISIVQSLLGKGVVAPLSHLQSMKEVYSRVQSLGLIWLGRDKVHLPWYLQRWQYVRNHPEDVMPAMWYVRSQSSGSDVESKNRDVWGYPKDEVIGGYSVMRPLLDALKVLPGFSAWRSLDEVDTAVEQILTQAEGRRVISMDFKGYDKTIPGGLMDLVSRELITHWTQSPAHKDVEAVSYIERTIGIVTPYGVLHGRDGGMPSGSVFTNLTDSLCNLVIGHYIAYRNNTALERVEVMGDDSVYLFKDDIEPEDVSRAAAEMGMVVSVDKLLVSTDTVHFLQRTHTLQYRMGDGRIRGVRSPYRFLSGATGYENLKRGWSKYMDSVRLWSQVHQCNNDPRFVEFVKLWREADQLSQTMSLPEIFARAGGSEYIRQKLGTASFRFGSANIEGVASWDCTKILTSLL